MKTRDLTKTDKKFIKRIMRLYADSLEQWPKFDDKGKRTSAAHESNKALLIANYKLAAF